MKLADYLRSEGIKPSRFAALVGVPASTVARLISGERSNPGLDLMKKIADASGGEVTPNDFAELTPKAQPADAVPDNGAPADA